MLSLLASTLPTNAADLTEALKRGLEQHGITAREVSAAGANFPALETLRVDLTDTRLTREFRAEPPPQSEGGVLKIADLQILATPIYFEKTPLEIRVTGENATAQLRLHEGQGVLVLEQAAQGEISVQIEKAALEVALHDLAKELAAKQGLEVKKTQLTVTQDGLRSAVFRAEVTAKVFVMSAALALTGRLDIDDALNARLSKLALDGDGMILKLAGGFARPYLDRFEGRSFALSSFTPAGLKLRDVEFQAGPTIAVRARFGAMGATPEIV